MSEAAVGPLPLSHHAFDTERQQVFVVGNEACDVDSLVSAFAVAQLLDSPQVEGVPVAQISRGEFRLRGDGLHLFNGSELAVDGSPRRLRFWDEVDWDAVRALEGRRLVLTDHNRMTAKVAECFEPAQVQWVLDHHADQQLYPDARRDLDETLGSACTLVQEQFAAAERKLTPELGRMLLGVILLDSRNAFDASGRGTARDSAAVEKLAAYMPEAGRDAWYKQMTEARHDVSHLSPREQLMVDMKVASVGGFEGSIAFCAVMLTLDEVVTMAGGPATFASTMQAFALEHGYRAVIANLSKDADGLKGLAGQPASEADEALVEAIISRVAGAPGNLPSELRENALYVKQGILEEGFGLQPRPELAPLKAFRMRNDVTRKTLLPRAVTEEASST